MFGSDVLEVGIGVTLLFLFVSLICSALREALEAVLKSRAMDLERGIRELLDDPDGTDFTKKVYDHPLVFSLFAGSYDPKTLKRAKFLPGGAGGKAMPVGSRSNLPTYIPTRNFAGAVLDLIRQQGDPKVPLSVASLMVSAGKLPDGKLKGAVMAAFADAENDVARARKNLEAWYDAAMDRVSGWYKRRTQFVLLAIGFGTAALFNIDAVNVTRHLSTDKAYRQIVVAQATAFAGRAAAPTEAGTDKAPAVPVANGGPETVGQAPASGERDPLREAARVRAQLEGAGFNLGWPAPQLSRCDGALPCTAAALSMLGGWIITALAVSLGAPFWFDILNKFMVVRSTVKPAEKSGREASKDSTAPADDGVDVRLVMDRAAAKSAA